MKKDIAGKWIVVTGGSSGIGYCFCREFASRGARILMVSNQTELLPVKANEIRNEFATDVEYMSLDLCDRDATVAMDAFLKEKDIDPVGVVNNAGIFSFNPVVDTSERKIECFIDLHVGGVTRISRFFAERFIKKGEGMLLNMSSMSCWMPMPGIAMYSATKSYIRVFTRALHYELRDYGVSATVACPGGIATDLFGLPDNLKRLAVRLGAITTPEKFTRKAVDRMLKGKKQYINGFLNRISIVFVSLLPTSVRMQIKRRMLDKGIRR